MDPNEIGQGLREPERMWRREKDSNSGNQFSGAGLRGFRLQWSGWTWQKNHGQVNLYVF